MVFKRFEVRLVIQITILTLTIFLFSWIWCNTSFVYTSVVLFMTIPAQVYWIYRLVGATNRKLASFFEAIKFGEFNYNFSADGQGKSFVALSKVFDEIMAQFQDMKQLKEEQSFFYKTVIQHIGVGLIAFRPGGQVIMSNNSVNRLLGFQNFENIDQLRLIDNSLYDAVSRLNDGQKQLVKIRMEDDLFYLSVNAKVIKQETGVIKVVSIQNIQTELEEQEIVSWQKLIRVLTHEIMNSITPVTSLTETLQQMFQNQSEFSDHDVEDIRLAINTIHKRSAGLLKFVDTYRNLTKIPQPKFERFKIADFIEEICKLLENDLHSNSIELDLNISVPEMEIVADESMMERVLINLLKNAIQAVRDNEKPKIGIRSYFSATGNVVIQVIDNGQGILPDVIDKIFIPFFTTRQGGSGIGLALSRQLVRAQGGTIGAVSVPGRTIFTVRF